ncbi:MAG: hypothetical protein QOJ98_2235, partial [Acidobacteriota bacterium]|nr:hypothetical protein [Acidobacteriota bacterium]
DTNSITECTDSIVKSTLLTMAEEKENDDTAAAPTGVPTIESFLGNSTRDFLSRFAAGLQVANLSEEQDALTLDWNLRVSELSGDPLKLQAVVRKPILWKEFSDQLADGVDRTKLHDQLEDFDDFTLTVSYGPESETRGRNLTHHLALFEKLHAGVPPVMPSTAEFELGARIREIPEIEDDSAKFNEIPADRRERARQAVIDAAKAINMSRAAFEAVFEKAALNRFSDLLDNQPQIYFSASRRERAELVGPRDTSIKATYEKGFVNVNTFRSYAKTECTSGTDQACADAFKTYVTDNKAGLDAANRISFSFEYSDSEDYKIEDDLVATPFDVKGSRVTNGSFVYGRMLRRDQNGRDGRMDLSVTYEDVRGDADKDNRFIASAVYTQKLSDTMSFPIGIVWSNRDKHVPDSDERLSAHFGLVFKMPKLMP